MVSRKTPLEMEITMSNTLAEIVRALEERDGFILVGHQIPDGDCIGSLVAMQLALQAMGKRSIPLLQDALPPNYYFLPGAEQITFTAEGRDYSAYPCVIYLDCADHERIGDQVLAAIAHTHCSINIDHHMTNNKFGDLNLIEDKAANGEIVYALIRALGVELTADIALALYTAIVMDTGNFSYADVTGDTLREAADLIDHGADPSRVHYAMNESKDVRDLQMLGRALSHLDFTEDRRLAWMSLSYAETVEFDAADLHPEGIVNYARKIKGVQVALMFRETEPGTVKVSMRSKSGFNVAELAAKWGGGGHIHASGAKRQGDLAAVKNEVVQYVKEVLDAH
jgi:phosphoesterase RecJ-like protein